MTKGSRGQAALEFLTTYGWAFMVILIMVSALGYFGILDPGDILPNTCTLPAGFTCDDHLITGVSQNEVKLQLSMTNKLGTSITIQDFAFKDAPVPMTTSCATSFPSQVGTGTSITIDCNAQTTETFGVPGDKQKLAFMFNYTKTGSSFIHRAEGEVYSGIG